MAAKKKAKTYKTLETAKTAAAKKPSYDCSTCTLCCSFPEISLSSKEIKVMADAEVPKMTPDQFKGKYLKRTQDGKRFQFRHKKHPIFGSICIFQMGGEKGCARYAVRPSVCSGYPNKKNCTVFDFLKEIRDNMGDQTYMFDKFKF